MRIERLSIELSELCSKGCGFCYNGSSRDGASSWDVDSLVAFVVDCAPAVKAFSFGGGEPLESPHLLFPVLAALRGRAFRSMTTNGLLLDAPTIAALATAAIDKVHVSIHTPSDLGEVARVIANVHALAAANIRSGVNLLVRKSRLAAAHGATRSLHAAGITNDRIVFLPMRGTDVPTPAEVAHVAQAPFQSTTCLSRCHASPRFVSISARRTIAWCSYTVERRLLAAPTLRALLDAVDGLGLVDCADDRGGLVKLTRRPATAAAPSRT